MKIPVVKGVIDRRILVNYHIDPAAIAGVLPQPFRPKLVKGYAIAGICLIRLKHVRPWFMPINWGLGSENAAHRIAVEWDENGSRCEGVYIPRRDTDSRLNTFLGGRIFPGSHHFAKYTVKETADRFEVSVLSSDGDMQVSVAGHVTDTLQENSVFSSLAEASAFFEAGSLGYSATSTATRFDGLELRCKNWTMQPLEIEHVTSSFFEETSRFPSGSVEFDSALLMRDIAHEWHSRGDLCGPA